MYNKAKNLMCKIAGFASLICGGLSLLFALATLILLVVFNYFMLNEAYYLLGLLIKAAAAFVFFGLGIKLMSNPMKVECGEQNGKKLLKWVYPEKLINLALIVAPVVMLVFAMRVGDGVFGVFEDYAFDSLTYLILNLMQIIILVLYVVIIATNIVTIAISDKKVYEEDVLDGEKFVIAGTFEGYATTKEVKNVIENLGGLVYKKITREITLVLAGAGAEVQIAKAESLGVVVITEEEFNERIKGRV